MARGVNLLGGGKSIFPSGYKFKALALGDTFPGFGPDIIPICSDVLASGSGSASNTWVSFSGQYPYNGKNAAYLSARVCNVNGQTSSATAYAYNVFLPIFFNFNYALLQNTVKTGTITAWLQRGGVVRRLFSYISHLFEREVR